MKALVFKEKGNSEEVLKIENVTLPLAEENEIVVKTIASTINPNDFMFIEKQYRLIPIFPQIAGFEGCGSVIDNNGNSEIPIGALVSFRHKNVWAEQVNVPKEKIVILPPNFPIDKASQLSLNPLTAWGLIEQSEATVDDWIILSAGTSSVSKLIIQLAKQKGIKTIAIVRDDNQTSELQLLGANSVIKDTNHENIGQQIKEIVGSERIKCFIDAVGGELATKVIPCISENGKVICYGLLSNSNVSYHNSNIIFKLITIKGFGIDNWIASKSKEELKSIWQQIILSVGQADFIMDVAEKFPLEDYKVALANSKTTTKGKVLLTIVTN